MKISNEQWLILGIRVVVTLGTIWVMSRLDGLSLLFGLLLCGVLAVIWASPIASLFGGLAGSLYMPSGEGMMVYREYSIAEARVKQGLYADAIAEFQKYKAEDPAGLTPYLRISDLLVDHFDDYPAAVAELRSAIPIAKSKEAFSLVQFRLADLLVKSSYDPKAALECLHEVQRRFPGTRQAQVAQERAAYLIGVMDNPTGS